MKERKQTLPFALYTVGYLLLIVLLNCFRDVDGAMNWIVIPFVSLVACGVAAGIFSPKVSWILPVVGFLGEFVGCVTPAYYGMILDYLFSFSSLWAPFAGYLLGLMIWLLRCGVLRRRA
jgi:uncharacterized membrane protein